MKAKHKKFYQTELVKLSDKNGNLTKNGKWLIEMYLKCTSIKGISLWNQIMDDPEEKKKMEVYFGKELQKEK